MKIFAIVDCAAGVFINRTDSGRSIPRQLIIGEADTYEEAVSMRDERRNQRAEIADQAADHWQNEWRKADQRGDMERLMQLCHANR